MQGNQFKFLNSYHEIIEPEKTNNPSLKKNPQISFFLKFLMICKIIILEPLEFQWQKNLKTLKV